jgi:AraC-like DNA-binding protein
MLELTWSDAVEPIHLTIVGNRGHYSYPEHLHLGYWELIVVRRGESRHTINGVEHRLGSGAVALIRDGDRHGVAGEGMEFVNLAVDRQLIEPLIALVLAPQGLDALAGRTLIGQLDSTARELVEQRLKAVEEALDRPALVSAWLAVAGVVLHAVLAPGRISAGPEWLQVARERLSAAKGVVSLATFRGWCGVSAEHLARTVKSVCATTPRGLIEDHRLQQAARALVTTDAPVGEIALAAGFTSARLLARRFRVRYGVTPSEWRGQRQT